MDDSDLKANYIAVGTGVVLCVGNLITGNRDIFGEQGYILSIITSGAMGYYFSARPWRRPIGIVLTALLALPGVTLSMLAGWFYRRLH